MCEEAHDSSAVITGVFKAEMLKLMANEKAAEFDCGKIIASMWVAVTI